MDAKHTFLYSMSVASISAALLQKHQNFHGCLEPQKFLPTNIWPTKYICHENVYVYSICNCNKCFSIAVSMCTFEPYLWECDFLLSFINLCSPYETNITIPIILTILASDRPTEDLQRSVAMSLQSQMLDLDLGDFEAIELFSKPSLFSSTLVPFLKLLLPFFSHFQTTVHRSPRYFRLQMVIPI